MSSYLKRIVLAVTILVTAACGRNEPPFEVRELEFYRNPVIQEELTDPSIVRSGKLFYLFVSEQLDEDGVVQEGLVRQSSDMLAWEETNVVFGTDFRPSFIEEAPLKTPDVVSLGGEYLMYYSLSSEERSGIGVASAGAPEGPWTDAGLLIGSEETGLAGLVSPAFFSDGSSHYLAFESTAGIFVVPLAGDGKSLSPGATPQQVSDPSFHAPSVEWKDGHFYLFATLGDDTGGAACTCFLTVCRSDSALGPYLSSTGERMAEGGYDKLIDSSTKFRGPGHGCALIRDDGHVSWLFYNAYDLSDVSFGRTLMMDRVNWTDGWPKVRGGVASFYTDAPHVDLE